MKIQLEIQAVVNGFVITDMASKRVRVCESEYLIDRNVREFVAEAHADQLEAEQRSRELALQFGLDKIASGETT